MYALTGISMTACRFAVQYRRSYQLTGLPVNLEAISCHNDCTWLGADSWKQNLEQDDENAVQLVSGEGFRAVGRFPSLKTLTQELTSLCHIPATVSI
jgi:hypothetical protein